MERWQDNLTIDDLEAKQAELAEVIGIESYKKLVEVYGGEQVYIRSADGAALQRRDQNIKADYQKGQTIRDLKQKYGLSPSRIRQILRGEPAPQLKGQISIEELLAQ